MPPPVPHHSLSPDPLNFLDDNAPRTPPRAETVEDISPAVRKPRWGRRVPRSPSETPSEEADRLSTAQLGLSGPSFNPSPEVDDSPPVRRLWGRSIDGTGHSHLKQAYVADADDDLDTLSYAPSQNESVPHSPTSEIETTDETVLSYLDSDSDRDQSVSIDLELEGPLPPSRPVSHVNGIGAVVVPFRPAHEFPRRLRDAEEKLASQIAAALTSPGDEGLNSETFQTLLETFLFPRLAGCNSKNQRFKLHQYSQLHAVACTFKQPPLPVPSGTGKRKRQDIPPTDADQLIQTQLIAVKERRVPDMTSMAIFEDRVPIQNSRAYEITARKGPKICITEIKSFDWNDDQERLASGLRAVLSKAHYQNYVAAQYLFREDKHLRHVGSFTGAGFAWSFSEFHRWQYPLLYERPLPMTEEYLKGWSETPYEKPPRKHKKTKRSSLMQDANAHEEDEADEDNEEYQEDEEDYDVEEEEEEEEEEEYPKFLEDYPNMPPTDTPLDEIFRRYEPPQEYRGQRRKRVSFLHILDPHGRTYEAFDVIVERMRRWYVHSKQNKDPDHRFIFDPDPYEDGTCPATADRKRMEREAAAQN